MRSFQRFFSPGSIAVIGGGTWCENVIRECRKSGFGGSIWPVHPKRDSVGGLPAYRSLADLPATPDAAFIGVNREATIEVAGQLSAMGCAGAVCFAAGFKEAALELSDGADLQDRLVETAGEMRILGPNCYGMLNALDGVSLWPDLHGLSPVTSGVAVIGQSSNVLVNLTLQQRGLPLAAIIAAGNQAQTSMATLSIALLDDPRITSLGLHIEGIDDVAAFEELARRSDELGKPIVALKVGASQQARQATISHTASLAGSDAGARALLARLGIARVDTPSELVETLKILHASGGLAAASVVSASCSGGEASLMADTGMRAGVTFPPLSPGQYEALRQALGPRVALANPLDYNTYIWGDRPALRDCFATLFGGDAAIGVVVADFPDRDRFDITAYETLLTAASEARTMTDKPIAILSLLAEGMPPAIAEKAFAMGLIPLCGMGDGLRAIRAAADIGTAHAVRHSADAKRLPVLVSPGRQTEWAKTLGESEAKSLLAHYGVRIPRAKRAQTAMEAGEAATAIGFPVALKGEGIAHKTEARAVRLNLSSAEAVRAAAEAIAAESFLVEEMIGDGVAEILVGVLRDPAHGFVLTLGAGGILTELLGDTVSMLIPASREDIRRALLSLRAARLLSGYRGANKVDLEALIDAVMAVQSFVASHAATLHEVEINPLICLPHGALAADALIRMEETP